MKEWRKENN